MGSRWLSRIGAVLVAGAVAMAVAAPAAAQPGTVSINPGNVPTTAEEFETHECDGPFSDLPDDMDGWHFVLPAGSGDSFVSLTLTFETPGGEVTVILTSTDPANPSTGPGWSGYLDGMHGWLMTEAGWTLVDGTAMVENPGDQDFFNLSHTCPGTPVTPSPSPSPSPSPAPSPSPSPSPSPAPSPSPSPSLSPAPTPGQPTGQPPTSAPTQAPTLPVSGSSIGAAMLLGLGLVGAGAGLLLALRRRRAGTDPAGG